VTADLDFLVADQIRRNITQIKALPNRDKISLPAKKRGKGGDSRSGFWAWLKVKR